MNLIKLITSAAIVALALNVFFSRPNQANLYQKVSESVFKVDTPIGLGTAFVINTSEGLRALTAAHVCDSSMDGSMLANKFNKFKDLKIKIIRLDSVADICLMEAPQGLPALNMAKGPLTAFQEIFSMGYPFGQSLQPHSGNLVAAVKNPLNPMAPIMEEATIQSFPGNSGGPIFDKNGNYIGIADIADLRNAQTYLITRKTIVAFLISNANQ